MNVTMQKVKGIHPALKWTGGKFSQMAAIRELLPAGNRLIEPFVGGGAVWLNFDGYSSYIISDTNAQLCGLYTALKRRPDPFIETARAFFTPATNNSEFYYEVRAKFNEEKCVPHDLTTPARLLYLNKHCFNGLMRWNSKGGFNAPFGKYAAVTFPEAALRAASNKLKRTVVLNADFEDVMGMAWAGDVIFADPPFIPFDGSTGFTSYNADKFSINDHYRLAKAAREARSCGISTVICNHDTDYTRQLYFDADQIVTVESKRRINCDATKRGSVNEIMALYRAKGM